MRLFYLTLNFQKGYRYRINRYIKKCILHISKLFHQVKLNYICFKRILIFKKIVVQIINVITWSFKNLKETYFLTSLLYILNNIYIINSDKFVLYLKYKEKNSVTIVVDSHWITYADFIQMTAYVLEREQITNDKKVLHEFQVMHCDLLTLIFQILCKNNFSQSIMCTSAWYD